MVTRHPRILLVVTLAIAAAALLVKWPFSSKMWWLVVEDSGHVPLFALLTAALFGVFRSSRGAEQESMVRNVRAYAVTALAAGVLAFGSELAQIPVGRDASWTDLRSDGLGIAIALALIAATDRDLALRKPVRLGLFGFCLAALVPVVWPYVKAARAYSHRVAIFPQLADFSTNRDAYWTIGLGARRLFSPGALTIEFQAERFPGVSWYEPEPDWRGYRWLLLDVENPTDVVAELTLRVHDQPHRSGYSDRFNHEFKLAPHERRAIRVTLDDIADGPRTRRMDLAHIAGVAVFRRGPPGPRSMVIYALGLEGNSE